MKKLVRQIVGIDVAQHELVICLGSLQEDFTQQCRARKAFANTAKGFESLVDWVARQTQDGIPVRYVMEATGVYHESLAYYLEGKGHQVSIILPNKISNFFRTLEVKTITDQTSAEAIALFGLSRNLSDWRRPRAIFKKLRQLSRERGQIIDERTVAKNQLHAEQSEAEPSRSSLERMRERIDLINRQEKEIKAELVMTLDLDEEVKSLVMLICTIPGVGLLTAVSVLAETNGFELIRNKRQLVSYAGLDVREKQSGTSIKGKPRISKRGNKYLRKAMHMPALAAIRHDERYKAIFARLVAKNGIKMKAAVAVQRKLLEMIFTISKSGAPYDKHYLKQQAEGLGIGEKIREQP